MVLSPHPHAWVVALGTAEVSAECSQASQMLHRVSHWGIWHMGLAQKTPSFCIPLVLLSIMLKPVHAKGKILQD